jgi:hypothetical protein
MRIKGSDLFHPANSHGLWVGQKSIDQKVTAGARLKVSANFFLPEFAPVPSPIAIGTKN